MPKIKSLGKDNYHDLDNIDIKGNGPAGISQKTWILIGLAAAAYFIWNKK